MNGYHGNPEATAEAFAGGWFHTGDLGYVDEDGFFFIVDRKKDLIIRGGYNVYPREVEDVLYAHPAVAEAAVIGVPDDRLGEEVKAFVALREAAQVDRAGARRLRQGAGRRVQVPPDRSSSVDALPMSADRQDPQAGADRLMDRMGPLDAAFLELKTPSRAPPWPSRRSRSSRGRPPARRSTPPRSAAGCRWCRGTGRRCGSCRSTWGHRSGSMTPTSTSATTCGAPRCPRPAGTGARHTHGARHVAAARPRPAAVGVLAGRGPGRRALGDDLQGPPLHGRRRLRHRPLPRDPRSGTRARAARPRRLAPVARAVGRPADRAGGPRPGGAAVAGDPGARRGGAPPQPSGS